MKVLKTSQGKVLTLNGDVLTTTAIVPTGTLNITENDTYDVTNYASAVVSVSGGGDIIEAINNTGAAISADDKVYIAPLATPQSGANYEIVPVKTSDSLGLGFFTVNGVSVNLTDKYAYDFSPNNFLQIPQVMDFSEPWEFNMCFQTGSSVSSNQFLYAGDGSTQTAMNSSGLVIWLNGGSICQVDFMYNNGSGDIGHPHVIPLVAANTTYYIKAGWTGTEYYAQYSLDGTTWLEPESRITSQTQVTQDVNLVRLGQMGWITSMYFQGKIFLDKTYFISNGKIIWQAMYDGTWSNIGKDVVTGIATESIASGSVGEVTTLLGE